MLQEFWTERAANSEVKETGEFIVHFYFYLRQDFDNCSINLSVCFFEWEKITFEHLWLFHNLLLALYFMMMKSFCSVQAFEHFLFWKHKPYWHFQVIRESLLPVLFLFAFFPEFCWETLFVYFIIRSSACLWWKDLYEYQL